LTSRSEEGLDLFSQVGDGDPVDLPPSAVEALGPPIFSVSELTHQLRYLLESRIPELWVSGEVANWTRARSGHCYFTLKDEGAQLRCVMWRAAAGRLPIDPEEGMRVRVFGAVTLYEARGDLQLSVRDLEGEGETGLWKLAFERLRERLEGEGLLDPARKRPIPAFPRTVGVVTSTTGAALHDILTVLARRAPWTRVLVRGCRVQGEGAALEIAQAIDLLAGSGRVDLLIVGRGGGSLEDLWAFNEEPVARAIASSAVPVISAVGHEVDVTIADLVADLRAPTPSAAAESAVPDGVALRDLLGRVGPRLARGLRDQSARRRTRLREAVLRAGHGLQRLLQPRRARLERRSSTLLALGREAMGSRRERLALQAGRMEALSPLATLSRGYAVPLTGDGFVLRTVDAVRRAGPFTLRVADGGVRCQAIEAEEDGG